MPTSVYDKRFTFLRKSQKITLIESFLSFFENFLLFFIVNFSFEAEVSITSIGRNIYALVVMKCWVI